MCITEKSKKIMATTYIKLFSSATIETKLKKITLNKIQWLNFVVHYLKIKIKYVDITYLKLCSSLEWDGVY